MTDDSSRLRMGILGVIVVSLFAAMLARLWYLQILAAPALSVEAQNNSVRFIATEAPRGRILDRNGKVIVDNRVVNAVTLTRDDAGKHPDVLDRLSPLLGISADDLRKRLNDDRFSTFKPVPLTEDVPKEKLIYIKEHQSEFPGLDAVQLTQRNYPNGALAAHLLGYVSQINDKELASRKDAGYKAGDNIGKSGVEQAYESDLRGQPAIEKLEVDSKGHVLRTLGLQAAVQGHDVQLTIDLDVQALAEESLQQGLDAARGSYDRNTGKSFLAPAGSAVVLDPTNGSVLAMASNPTYDPRVFVDGISQANFAQFQDPAGFFPLNNRVLQGLYAPGSTFKLVTGIAALDKGLIAPIDTVADTGSITVGGQIFRNALSEPHGRIAIPQAVTVSSDVFFYDLGKRFWEARDRYGQTAIQDMARTFGMGSLTGIELPFESEGRVPDPASRKKAHDANPEAFPTRDWFTGDNMNLAVGQGELVVSPLQLANAYSAFANGGMLYAPRVGANVLDVNAQVVRKIEPQPIRKVEMSPSAQEPLLTGFKGAVADPKGTAFPAFKGFPLAQFPVAGKTGTAEVAGKQDTALFSGFAPADNPKFEVTVVMEQSGFGASAAAPVARRVFEKLAGLAPQPVNRVGGND
ncbi:MAG: penicillin-binding protein 2 [Actinomycetota bacterium]|nr:penicillin-binding protein 2 [Actinomycetota bacterium]